MSTRKQLSLLLAALIGGTSLVAAASTLAVFLIRNQIVHLSRETSPTQVRLAKLQRGFERISTLFTRISAASTLAELSFMESDLGRTIGDVQSIAVELAATTNSGGTGVETGVIQTMTRTGDELRRTAWQRIEARKQIAEANRNVAAEIETVTTVTGKLSAAMAQLQKSSQAALVSSKQTSLDANTGIKALLVDGEKIEQLRSCLQEVRIIDKKFRLNPLRDKTGGILDSMAAQDLPGKMLTAQVKRLRSDLRLRSAAMPACSRHAPPYWPPHWTRNSGPSPRTGRRPCLRPSTSSRAISPLRSILWNLPSEMPTPA
jgi:hypothetical protein